MPKDRPIYGSRTYKDQESKDNGFLNRTLFLATLFLSVYVSLAITASWIFIGAPVLIAPFGYTGDFVVFVLAILALRETIRANKNLF